MHDLNAQLVEINNQSLKQYDGTLINDAIDALLLIDFDFKKNRNKLK